DDHFDVGAQALNLASVAAISNELDADRAVVFDDYAFDQRVRKDIHVRLLHRRVQEGARRAPAPRLEVRRLIDADAGLPGAIEIAVVRHAVLLAGLDQQLCGGTGEGYVADVQGARVTVIIIGNAVIVFRFLEKSQDVIVSPALELQLVAPSVVILPGASYVDLPVDRTRAAIEPALRNIHFPVMHMLLRNRPVGPVELGTDAFRVAGGHMNEGVAVGTARFEHANRHIRVLGEPVGDGAAGRASSEDDVVVTLARSEERR